MATAAVTVAATKKSFFASLKAFFSKAKYYVNEGLVAVFGQAAAQHFAVASLEVLKTGLGKIALTAVAEAEKMAAGTDKRAVAFASIGSAAKAAGIDAKDSIVNMLIEMSVQAVNGAFGQKA